MNTQNAALKSRTTSAMTIAALLSSSAVMVEACETTGVPNYKRITSELVGKNHQVLLVDKKTDITWLKDTLQQNKDVQTVIFHGDFTTDFFSKNGLDTTIMQSAYVAPAKTAELNETSFRLAIGENHQIGDLILNSLKNVSYDHQPVIAPAAFLGLTKPIEKLIQKSYDSTDSDGIFCFRDPAEFINVKPKLGSIDDIHVSLDKPVWIIAEKFLSNNSSFQMPTLGAIRARTVDSKTMIIVGKTIPFNLDEVKNLVSIVRVTLDSDGKIKSKKDVEVIRVGTMQTAKALTEIAYERLGASELKQTA